MIYICTYSSFMIEFLENGKRYDILKFVISTYPILFRRAGKLLEKLAESLSVQVTLLQHCLYSLEGKRDNY